MIAGRDETNQNFNQKSEFPSEKKGVFMSDQEKVLEVFEKSDALLKGHFLLSSGLHSDIYFEKFQVLQYPAYVDALCQMLAKRFEKDKIDVVVGPTTGGIIISYQVGRNLGTRAIFAEREDDNRIFKRGFKVAEKERTLVVDDVITTGGSVKEVVDLVEKHRGKIVGIGVLLDRSGGKIEFGYRFEALARVTAKTYDPSDCPLCKQNLPLVKPGSRKSAR
jgi:orotate phosphoribosyltransferase